MAGAAEGRGCGVESECRVPARGAGLCREREMSKLRVGWIGCGTHANEMLLPQITRFDVALTALCDIDAARLQASGERFGVAAADRTTDWRALLARSDLDAVAVAAGPAAHAEIGLAAVARKLPVFIEKATAATAVAAGKTA